jgi:hypothetical protein
MRPRFWPGILVLCAVAAAAPAWADGPGGCLPKGSVPLVVRMGDAPPVAALLQAGLEVPLSVVEAGTGRLLWSAGTDSVVQRFDGLDAPFTGSLAAIDLDADGLHDRIYAGDMAARLWRFDVQHGAPAGEWLTGGVFADFRNAEGRGFIAPPDISLSAPPGATAWLNIALGTAAPGNPAANNRLYVLRDHAVYEAWSARQYEDWRPVREKDLQPVPPTLQDMASATALPPDQPGWYVALGGGHVLTPTLTVAHRLVLVIAEAVPQDGPCEIFARTGTLDLAQARVIPSGTEGQWLTRLPRAIDIGARLRVGAGPGSPVAPCTLGGQQVTGCEVDTRPRKTWWRRTDAE